MRKIGVLLVAVLMIVFVAPGCGDDDDGGDQPANSESDGGGSGLDSEAVEEVQTQLAAIGCYDGPIDGVEGPETSAAILNFQRAQGLSEDGVAGPETRAALETAVEAGVENCSADGE